MDLWTEASRDIEAEQGWEDLTRAKVAVATLWPFLAAAGSKRDFDHRLALVQPNITELVPVHLHEPVTASLTEDFRLLHEGADAGAAAQQMYQNGTMPMNAPAGQMTSTAPPTAPGAASTPPAGGGAPTAPSAPSGGGDANVPPTGDASGSQSPQDMRMVTSARDDYDWRHPDDGPDRREAEADDAQDRREQSEHDDYMSDVVNQGPPKHGRLEFFHAGLGRWVAADDDANAGKGNPGYFVGGPEAGPQTGQTNQYPTFPVGNPGDPWNPMNAQYPMQPSPWAVPPGGEWRESPMNFDPPGAPAGAPQTRQGSRHPFVAADRPRSEVGDTDLCRDCGLPVAYVATKSATRPYWSHTGKHGGLADDDHSPAPKRYQGARIVAQEGVAPTPGPNPNYFSGGGEGATGDPQSGFPEDVTLPEDEEDRVSTLYGGVPPQVSKGSSRRTATEENRPPDSERNLGTEFASSQERERFEKMRRGDDPGSRDSTATVGSLRQGFMQIWAAEGEGAGSGAVPEAPPTMQADGPGATAMPPMQPGATSSGMGGGAVPQSTPPRQMPGGGGAANVPQAMASRHHGESGQSMNRPTAENPFGTEDPFDAKTWENQVNQRPRVPMEHMNFNGPQNPNAREQIRTVQSPGQREEEDER